MNLYEVTRKDIEAMDGISFEELVMSMYEELGYECAKTPASNDYGTDIIVETPIGKFSIQCKRQTSNVGIKAVQEVYGSLPKYGAVKGIVIASSGYTASAVELAKACNVELIDGDRFWDMVSGMQNGEFIKNSKENIREELDKISTMMRAGNEHLKQLEDRAKNVVDRTTLEIEYLKNVTNIVDTKLQMLEGKIIEINNIELPKSIIGPKGEDGKDGAEGKPGEIPSYLKTLINITSLVSIANTIAVAYIIYNM